VPRTDPLLNLTLLLCRTTPRATSVSNRLRAQVDLLTPAAHRTLLAMARGADSVDEPAVAVAGIDAPHAPRPIRFLRRERFGAWRLKVYGIALPGRAARPEFVDAALELAPSVFPAPAREDDRYGVGFVIAHDAATACLALYYWWQSSNECHYRAYGGPLDDPHALTKIENPGVGCVWELHVVDFESRAWLNDVLDNPDGPDLDRYMTRRVDDVDL
jgi:hypothetical protein